MEPLKTDIGIHKPQSIMRKSKKGFKPEGAVKWGRCPGCEEMDWLFKWEGDEPMCESCIQEAHDDYDDAMDIMNEPIDYGDVDTGEEWGEEGEEYF